MICRYNELTVNNKIVAKMT